MSESLPLGIRLNNPGNIERGINWQGLAEKQLHPRFATFKTPHDGLRAIAKILITYATHRRARDGSPIDTLQEIAERWAPKGDKNDPAAYAKILSGFVGASPTSEIDLQNLETITKVIAGIVRAECGRPGAAQEWFSITAFRQAAMAAGIRPNPTPTKSLATAVGSTAGAGSIDQIQQILTQTQDSVMPLIWYLDYARWALLALAIVSAAITIYLIFRQPISNKGVAA